MHTRIEQLPNVPEYVAFMHGPILLAAKTGTEDLAGLLADDGRWGQTASGRKLPLDKAPIIVENDLAGMTEKLVPVNRCPSHVYGSRSEDDESRECCAGTFLQNP